MNGMLKRVFAMLLVIAMAISIVPMQIFGADEDPGDPEIDTIVEEQDKPGDKTKSEGKTEPEDKTEPGDKTEPEDKTETEDKT